MKYLHKNFVFSKPADDQLLPVNKRASQSKKQQHGRERVFVDSLVYSFYY
jgi:hypothetical protein